MMPICPACSETGTLRYQESIDSSKVSDASFSSRKKPELMHYDYFECPQCATLFTFGIDTSKLIASYELAPLDASLESQHAARTYSRLVINSLQCVPSSVLDIGCGDGAFLSLMSEYGSQISHGLEPSRAAASQCKDSRVEFKGATIDSLEHDLKYDAVCLFQTVEHVQNPKDLIRRLASHMNASGSLFVICHDRHSTLNRILGSRSPIFDIEHLQIFTPSGICSLIESSGLHVTKIQRFTNRYALSYALRLAAPNLNAPNWTTKIPVLIPAGNLFVQAVL